MNDTLIHITGGRVIDPHSGFDAVADNIAPSQVVERIVAMVPPPTPVWNQQQRDQSHTQHRHNPSYSS